MEPPSSPRRQWCLGWSNTYDVSESVVIPLVKLWATCSLLSNRTTWVMGISWTYVGPLAR